MQSSIQAQPNSIKNIFISLILGTIVGLLSVVFIKSLEKISFLQNKLNFESKPYHLLLLPICLLFLIQLKKRTLFFPVKIAELTDSKSAANQFWSKGMSFFNFFGALFSHLSGASVGREGSVVLISSGLVRLFNLNWQSWGVVAVGCGFSAILGHPWIGLIFVSELFKTSLLQKIYVLMSSYVSVLILQSFEIHHLLKPIEFQKDFGFFAKFIFIFILAMMSGLLMRAYKWMYYKMSQILIKSIGLRILGSIMLLLILSHPYFRRFQSLGLSEIQDLTRLQPDFIFPLIKLLLTLFSLALGFWGGEFIPLFVSGIFFGAAWAHALQIDNMLGIYLGSYLLFAGATRLKWTSFFLIFSLLGWSWVLWIYFLVTLTIKFSGNLSIYKQNE